MTMIRKLLTTGAIAGLVGIGALAATSTAASARTVCNRDGDCWHESGDRYQYPATFGVRFHNDSWHRSHHDRNHWRDNHEGRGYYRQGLWVTF
ncbi:MAG TPA: hypothetical protein VII56_20925 [Rhizomicrobium sp.]